MPDSPELAAAKRLLDDAKDRGFSFRWIAFGPDAPLWGRRETAEWVDELYLGGFWAENSCSATRRPLGGHVCALGGDQGGRMAVVTLDPESTVRLLSASRRPRDRARRSQPGRPHANLMGSQQ